MSSTPATANPPQVPPPPLPTLDTTALRRALAGLADPDRPGVGEGIAEATELRETAARLCSILASLFGEELDRLTLWSRIDSALEQAGAKVADGDLDRYVSLCLEHVKADAGKAAACEGLRQLFATFAARPIEWRQALVRHIASRRYAVVVRGRDRWEQVKAKEIDL